MEGDKYAGGKGIRANSGVGPGLCSPPEGGSEAPQLCCADETSFEAGIRVQIHSQEEPPYIHQLGFGVSPGFQTFVSCQEQRVSIPARPRLGTGQITAQRDAGQICLADTQSASPRALAGAIDTGGLALMDTLGLDLVMPHLCS